FYSCVLLFFFLNYPSTTEIYTLSLHDALPIYLVMDPLFIAVFKLGVEGAAYATIISQGFAFVYGIIHVLRKKLAPFTVPTLPKWDRKSTRLNSSHVKISYAVFCLKKKKTHTT